jgi:hypothetical protein
LAEGRLNASDDVIATLSGRVSELSKRVALLQAELESSTKRLAIYEEHDSTIQDALSGALRAAYQIRERADTTAGQILEQAREERRMLLKEIERLRDERDQLQDEIATQRRSGIAAVAPRPLSSDAATQELRAVASEALKGLFQEIVDDMRSAQRPAVAPRAPEPTYREEPRPAEPRREEPRPAPAPQRVTEPAAPPAARVEPAPQPTYEAMARVKRASLTEEEEAAAPVAAAPAPAPVAPAPEPAPEPEPVYEIEEIEPAAAAPAPAPAVPEPVAPAPEPVREVAPEPFRTVAETHPPLEVVRAPIEIDEIAPPRVEAASPTSDIQLVLSPIGSFPRLVEIERHIQALSVVRTLYVRDFRGGVATLAIALRSSMTPEEFAGMLASLQQPRMRLVAGSRNRLELRIEGEASIA